MTAIATRDVPEARAVHRRRVAWACAAGSALVAIGALGVARLLPRAVEGALPAYEPDPADIVLGAEDAPVTILAFVSLTCSHCRDWVAQVLPNVRRELVETGRARLVLREFPIDDPSLAGAVMLRALPQAERLAARVAMERDIASWHAQAAAGNFGEAAQAAAEALTEQAAIQLVVDRRAGDIARYRVRGTPMFVVGRRAVNGALPSGALATLVGAATPPR